MINLLSTGGLIGIAIGGVVVLIIFWIIMIYNKLIKAKNKVKNQFAQIDVQLKRRFDLIPNLVETVKGYAAHEEKILTTFANARKMYIDAKSNDDVGGMAKADSLFGRGFTALLNAVREQYPQLQANSNFQKLMAELKDTEDKIAYQRQFYNDVVLSYNNIRELFPGSLVATIFSFKESQYFESDEESRQNVQVKF